MKRILVLLVTGTIFMTGHVHAQKMNTDSMQLANRIASDQLKLGKLTNQLDQKRKDKENTAAQAQKSADENQKAASDLAANPQDRSLARKADREASRANRDARKARTAASDLDDLNKDISRMNEKILKQQEKLHQKYPPVNMVAAPPAIPADSTNH